MKKEQRKEGAIQAESWVCESQQNENKAVPPPSTSSPNSFLKVCVSASDRAPVFEHL